MGRVKRGRRLRAIFAAGLILIALVSSATASLGAPLNQTIDLCALLPSGPNYEVDPAAGAPPDQAKFTGCEVYDKTPYPYTDMKFFYFEIAYYGDTSTAQSEVEATASSPVGSFGEKWVPTTAFGDPGSAFVMAALPPSDPSNPANTQVSAKLTFARGCYVATGDAGWVGSGDYHLLSNAEILRIAASVDGALKASPCGSGAAPAATATATATTVPNSNIVMHIQMAGEYVNNENHTWPFGKSSQMKVNVFPWDNAAGQQASIDPSTFNPVQVKFSYDGKEIGSGDTDTKTGSVSFDFTPPDDTPQGLTHHQFKAVASKQGYDSVETTMNFDIARGLQGTAVSVDAIGGAHRPDETITIKGQVWAKDKSGSFTTPVAANILVSGPGSSAAGTSDAGGYFSVDLAMNASKADIGINGTVSIRVTADPADKDHFYGGEGFLQVLVSPKGTLTVSAATNKGVYSPDEPVTVSGQVLADDKPIAASVDVVLNGSVLVATVQAGADGHYQYTFVPSSVPDSPQSPQQVPPGQRNPKPGSGPNPNPITPLKFSSTYVIAVTPSVSGYAAGADGDAYFTVANPGDECQAQEMVLSQLDGFAFAQLSNAQVGPVNTSPISALQPGMGVSQNIQVFTPDSSRATFKLSLGGTDQATIALNGETNLQIGTYCRDSSGKVHIILLASNPGQVLVNWPTNANADIKIATPSGDVSSVHTRYFISVDQDGTTTLTGLEGTARLTDSQGSTVDVDAGYNVSVPAGQSVSGAVPVATQGQVDPKLVAMLEPAGSTAPGSQSSNGPTVLTFNSFNIALYTPWLIAAGAGILLLAILFGFALSRSRSRRPATAAQSLAMPMPMPAEQNDPFVAMEAQYRWMRGELAAGRISVQQFDATLAGMSVRDGYGRTWMLNRNDGLWLVYDGRAWVYANPHPTG